MRFVTGVALLLGLAAGVAADVAVHRWHRDSLITGLQVAQCTKADKGKATP